MFELPKSSVQDVSDVLKRSAENGTMTFEERLILQRCPSQSLVSQFDDLKDDEILAVQVLEEKNLFRILNSGMLLYGEPSDNEGKELQKMLFNSPFVKMLYKQTEPSGDFSKSDAEFSRGNQILRYLLRNCNENIKAPLVFEGKIPSRPFKFRQITAESWFGSYAERVSQFAGFVYAYRGKEDALCYIFAAIAHHLYWAQPSIYQHVSNVNDENETVYEIMKKFTTRVSRGNADHFDFSFFK